MTAVATRQVVNSEGVKQRINMKHLKDYVRLQKDLADYTDALKTFANEIDDAYVNLVGRVYSASIFFDSLEQPERDRVSAIRTFREGIVSNARSLAAAVAESYGL